MAYFLVTSAVYDGEFEYWRHIPVEAATQAEAIELALEPDREWTEDDYRMVKNAGCQEIPEADYRVLEKYL